MAGARRDMLSVGIDVGTTTTQVVFSRLVLRDAARVGLVPRIEVDEASLLHAGTPRMTPLKSAVDIDVEALASLVAAEYDLAGVDRTKVETGAVIITGETARKQNADALLAALADLAGEFVVTVAGPNVEAQIAGRGSGAAAYAAEHYAQVTNVDVGGGTSNAAVFRMDEHRSSAALAVGGRQIEIDHASGVVRHLAPPGALLTTELGLPLRVGQPAALADVRRFCEAMADLIVDLLEGVESPLGAALRLTPPLRHAEASGVVFLSGGVGSCFYDDAPVATLSDVTRYDDVGPLLAHCLRTHPRLAAHRVLRPPETIRATVLGAATQTVTLSGTTIWAEERLLPLRNLPVVRPHLEPGDLAPDALVSALAAAVERWDAEGHGRVALALDIPPQLDYETLSGIAKGLAAHAGSLSPGTPMVLLTQRDYAQAIGQTVKGLRADLPLVVVDQVGLGEGDVIDIGTPIMGGRVVPLSVKTLVFYS
jgi:ethanolamine utilization protein EutA